jgi:PAS domain S-box-containing protein
MSAPAGDFPLTVDLAVKDGRGSSRLLMNSAARDESGCTDIVIRDITAGIEGGVMPSGDIHSCGAAYEASPDIVYRVDTDGIITFISDSISSYGYSSAELIGRNILDIVHPDDREDAYHRIIERRTGDRMTRFYELRLLTKDSESFSFSSDSASGENSRIFTLCAGGLYDSDNHIGSQGVYTDVTDRRMMESALKHSEEKLVSIMENLADGYCETDSFGRVLYVNRALASRLGYEKEDMLGQSFSSFFDASHHEAIDALLNGAYEPGHRIGLMNWTALTRKGGSVGLEISFSVTRTGGGGVFFAAILRDVSGRARMQHELIMSRKYEAIGILAGGIAHDYNNALTVIIGNLSLARMEIDPRNTGLHDTIKDAETAALKIKDLTHQLSSFARAGKPEKKDLEMGALLSELKELVFSDGERFCEIEIAADLSIIRADPYQMEHALEYLMIKARESMPSGGRALISAENITIPGERIPHGISLVPGGYVLVKISYDGPGMSRDEISRILNPSSPLNETPEGAGLSVSYAVIRRHKGYIDVDSEAGKNSVFYIYLPV